MNRQALDEFSVSTDTLRVYKDTTLLFTSRRERFLALLEYIDGFAVRYQGVVIFDKVVGNAAALLSIKASCQEIYSPLGSQRAVETLKNYGIRYHLNQIVPYIRQVNQDDMCPMEKLSLNKDPDEFYAMMRARNVELAVTDGIEKGALYFVLGNDGYFQATSCASRHRYLSFP